MTRQSYATEIRIVRVMCTGRVDLSFIMRAFLKGADGVIVGGCWPGECHYVTEGNYDALGNVFLARMLLRQIGLNSDRVRLEWIAASEGSRFAEVMSDFSDQLKEIGPLGQAEGLDDATRKRRLDAMWRILPYLKLVEREKLRVPEKSEKAYKSFYVSADTERLFHELVAEKLALSEILLLLQEQPLSTGEIAERLALSPSEVARYMSTSSQQGLVRYDPAQSSYTLA